MMSNYSLDPTMNDSPSARVRVMIVEDNHDTRTHFSSAIAADQRTELVGAVASGAEALALLPAASPDVLLVDLGLPDMHGTEVIRYAGRTLPACDIMVISVFADERNVLASIEAGAVGYVLKDSGDADLIAQILEMRAGGAPMSPGIARMVLGRMHAKFDAIAPRDQACEISPPHEPLTARETDVLHLLSRGYSYAEIGERLFISVHTVTSHIKNSYRKLAVHTAAAAVTRATELRLLDKRD
jgi:DNA-binding NarL/FixJ family response regulator